MALFYQGYSDEEIMNETGIDQDTLLVLKERQERLMERMGDMQKMAQSMPTPSVKPTAPVSVPTVPPSAPIVKRKKKVPVKKLIILIAIIIAVGVVLGILYHDGVLFKGAISDDKYYKNGGEYEVGKKVVVKAQVTMLGTSDDNAYRIIWSTTSNGYACPLGAISIDDKIPKVDDVIIVTTERCNESIRCHYGEALVGIWFRIRKWEKCWIPLEIPPLL